MNVENVAPPRLAKKHTLVESLGDRVVLVMLPNLQVDQSCRQSSKYYRHEDTQSQQPPQMSAFNHALQIKTNRPCRSVPHPTATQAAVKFFSRQTGGASQAVPVAHAIPKLFPGRSAAG